MVHALKEIWRTLVPGGILIDLRPRHDFMQVDVTAGERVECAGLIDTSAYAADDSAADNAMAQIESDGRFRREREATFAYNYYFDTLDEMIAHAEAHWESSLPLPESLITGVKHLLADMGAEMGAKVVVRRNMIIGRYRKLTRAHS